MEDSFTNISAVLTQTRDVVGVVIPASALVLIILLTVFGNLALVISILKTPRLREKASNMFVVNLSLTDLMNAALVMSSSLVSLIADDWVFGTYWCYGQCALNYWFIIVSMLTLGMISIDGYYAIIHPMHYMNIITPNVTKVAICYAWFQGCIFALIPAVYRWVVYDYWEVVCAIDWDNNSQDGALIYVIIACILCFLLPMIVMIYSYLKISCAIRNSGATLPQMAGGRDRKKQDMKIIKSLVVVVGVFLICMTPFCLTKVFKIILGTHSLPPYVNLISSWFAFLSNATNPFIYGIFRSDFRRAMMSLFRGRRIYPDHARDNSGVRMRNI